MGAGARPCLFSGLFSSALAALKQAKDLLPDGSKKAEAEAALERAEREFQLAEAETARQLGYQLCKKHFPPEIMLSEDEHLWECPQCCNTKKIGPAGEIIHLPERRSRWRT